MRRPVYHHHLGVLVDLVHDPEVPASGRIQALEFAAKRLSRSLGILGDRPEDRFQDRVANLFREPVQMSETFGCDLDPIGQLPLVSERESLPRRGLPPRTTDGSQ